MLDIDRDGPAYREVRASYFSNKSALPASTLLQVSRLANPEYLLEAEALRSCRRRREPRLPANVFDAGEWRKGPPPGVEGHEARAQPPT